MSSTYQVDKSRGQPRAVWAVFLRVLSLSWALDLSIVALRGGWGLGNALFVATALTAIVSLSNSGTAKAVILYEAAIGLGISVGPLVGGFLGAITWRGPFIGAGVLMAVAFIFLITFMPGSKRQNAMKKAHPTSLLDPFRSLKHRAIVVLSSLVGACCLLSRRCVWRLFYRGSLEL